MIKQRVLAICVAASLGSVVGWASIRLPQTYNGVDKPSVNVEILTKTVDGAVNAESMQWTNVRFRVTNLGSKPLRKLEVETPCSVRTLGPIPEEFAPGNAFELDIRVKAPPRGKSIYRVPIYADLERRPIAVLSALVETVIHPPLLATPLHDLQLIVVEGDEILPLMRLTTIERVETLPWITGLSFDSLGPAELQLAEMSQTPDGDSRYCHRHYVFSIAPRVAADGISSGVLQLDVREELAAAPPPVICHIERLLRLAIFPAEIDFGMDRNPVRFSVVDRLGQHYPTIRIDGEACVAVRNVDGMNNLFEVSCDEIPKTTDTRLIVECPAVAPAVVSLRWSSKP